MELPGSRRIWILVSMPSSPTAKRFHPCPQALPFAGKACCSLPDSLGRPTFHSHCLQQVRLSDLARDRSPNRSPSRSNAHPQYVLRLRLCASGTDTWSSPSHKADQPTVSLVVPLMRRTTGHEAKELHVQAVRREGTPVSGLTAFSFYNNNFVLQPVELDIAC